MYSSLFVKVQSQGPTNTTLNVYHFEIHNLRQRTTQMTTSNTL